jgi:site-specific DNA-cytosine methylase
MVLSVKELEYMGRRVEDGRSHWDFRHHSDIKDSKSATVVANFFKGVPYNVLKSYNCIRKFHPIECERLQTIPDGFTEFGTDEDGKIARISNTQRYKCLGNAWTVDVVSHILKGIE